MSDVLLSFGPAYMNVRARLLLKKEFKKKINNIALLPLSPF